MPLIGIVGGQRVESWKLSKADWTELKGSYRHSDVIMTCGQAGYPKTSPLGTQFFSHKSGSNCTVHDGGPETQQHLRAKAMIAEIARDLGWIATVECPSSDRSWIADVMIEKGGRRIAAEVQWSTQSDAEFRRRQVRYEADDVECIWFAGPSNTNNVSGVPSYLFSESVDDVLVQIPMSFVGPGTNVPMAVGLRYILGEGIRPRIEAIVAAVEIRTVMRRCWSPTCGKWLSLWFVADVMIETRCGQTGVIASLGGYQPWQAARIEQQLQSDVIEQMKKSDIAAPVYWETRYSKIEGVYYIAQICPSCNRVQGDGFIGSTWDWKSYLLPVRKAVNFSVDVLCAPHVCADRGNGSCNQNRAANGAEFPPALSIPWLIRGGVMSIESPALPARESGARRRERS